MSTVQKKLKSSSFEEKCSEFLIFSSLSSLFFRSREKKSDCRLLLVGFPECFAALWMLRGQGRLVDKIYSQCYCCFHTKAESKTCQRLSLKTLWVISLSPYSALSQKVSVTDLNSFCPKEPSDVVNRISFYCF